MSTFLIADIRDQLTHSSSHVIATQYHPDANPGDEEAARIFLKVGTAYAFLCDSVGTMTPRTAEHARQNFEDRYGQYRYVYYSDGAIIGMPYGFDLHESLEQSRSLRESLLMACGRLRIGVLQTWLIKLKKPGFNYYPS